MMSNIIEFLDVLGQQSDLELDQEKLQTLLADQDLSKEVQQALLKNDHQALEMLLDARTKIVCLIMPAEEDDEESDDEEESQKDNESGRLKRAC
jgi:hypothetical protein